MKKHPDGISKQESPPPGLNPMHNSQGPYSTAPPVAVHAAADVVMDDEVLDEVVELLPSSSGGNGPLGIWKAAWIPARSG